ncbi:MAG: DEAD/DEAH box helicase [Alphaproteobacteria bacterium]
MQLKQIISSTNKYDIEKKLCCILNKLHENGPIDPEVIEQLTYIKEFHKDIFSIYENKLMFLLGLFYKTSSPLTFLEECYNIYASSIKDEFGEKFTPIQANAYTEIQKNTFFSFSAPTSIGKSFLFRKIISNHYEDLVIIVPSRALIAEYLFELNTFIEDKSTLILQFVENINVKHTKKRIFILTPERASELFKFANEFNITLFLFDEAQISEDGVRGMKFDALVRRINKKFSNAKKIFAHPFVSNPEAQLKKHSFNENTNALEYRQQAVGKIYISYDESNKTQAYFSPYCEKSKNLKCLDIDLIENILNKNGTILIYTAKANIYNQKFMTDFSKYIKLCSPIKDVAALQIINELKDFIGVDNIESSIMLRMMKFGIVFHHGSIPLYVRLLIEKFITNGFAKICFATATLIQGVNMPFDVVWIDNFVFNGNINEKVLSLKNLIGRAGRTSQTLNQFDYGYVVIKKANVSTFSNRIMINAQLEDTSDLDKDICDIAEDLKDIVEAIKDDTFDENNQLPEIQVERISSANIQDSIKFILDHLFSNNMLLSAGNYYKIDKTARSKVKKAFSDIYKSHLRRNYITSGEETIISAAIPILLWRVQGRSFGAIVNSRYAYITSLEDKRKIKELLQKKNELTHERNKSILKILSNHKIKKDILLKIEELLENKNIDQTTINYILSNIPLKYSAIAEQLPNASLKKVPPSLFATNSTTLDFQYDLLVFDTYDYLDKVISFSISTPICTAFQKYYEETNDIRANMMKNYIKYGTNDESEIWLQKYGYSFEDVDWIKKHVRSISKDEIIFAETISNLSKEKLEKIKKYINK